MTHTYASVTGSILKRIREGGHGEFHGKPVCPPDGQFQIVLYPGSNSGLAVEYMYGKVRLLFSYPNLYLEAFSSTEVWYRFRNTPADIIPGGVSEPLHLSLGTTIVG
ncbi:unnamed protein product [Urochloa decumbens]|uniref:Uncharacterized protein n=1 Tax=Urochloa decumbens TaxID=240449 RepID=A0ABC8YQ40_9POAL